jgi:RNase P/RNase MRP subunit p29
MFFRAMFAGCTVLTLLVPVYGQGPRGKPGPQPVLEAFDAAGTIEGLLPNGIQINSNANQRWVIMIPRQAKIEVTGTATADFLRPGLYVRFTAEVDKHGTVKEKVAQLSIFTPSRETPPGLFSPEAGGAGVGGGGFEGFGPGPGGGVGKPPVGIGKPLGKIPGKAAPAATAKAYTVAGQVTAARNNKLTVNAGTASVKFEVTDDATIDVKMADYSLARKGDKVSVQGRMMKGRPGMGEATSVKIELVSPLSGGKAKPSKPAPKHETRPPKKPAGAKEPPAVAGPEPTKE